MFGFFYSTVLIISSLFFQHYFIILFQYYFSSVLLCVFISLTIFLFVLMVILFLQYFINNLSYSFHARAKNKTKLWLDFGILLFFSCTLSIYLQ